MAATSSTVKRDVDLEAQARALASSPSLWLPFARFEEPRFRLKLNVSTEYEAWLLTWLPGQTTGLHDHGGASGCFTVLEASVWETVIDERGRPHETRFAAGAVRSFEEDIVHEVCNVGTVGAITFAEAQKLANAVGITLLVPSPAADQNAFAVTRAFSEKNGITSLSDLAEYSKTNKVTLGGPAECPTRPFCQPGLEKTYGLNVGDFVSLDAGGPLTKTALSQGKIDVGLIFSSDGGVAANDFVVLQDDKSLQTVDNIVAAVNTAALTPALEKALNDVNAALTTSELVSLNKQVDIDRADPATVAQQWLKSKGLVS